MRYRKPEELKETDVEWIGKIPKNWSCTLLRRKIKGHKQGYYTTDSYIQEGIKLVRITDLNEKGDITYKDMPYVPINSKDYQDFKIEKKDFLFPRTGSIGLFGVVKDPEKAVFASYLIRFKFNDSLSSNFLKYYFQSLPFEHGIKRNLHGGVNQNIHAEDIKNQYLVIPSQSQQRSIAAFLDRKTKAIDGLIQKKEKLIERLKEKRQALITRAVTKGLDPNVPMKDSGIEWLGGIPEHWDLVKLKFLTLIEAGAVRTGPFGSQLKSDEMMQSGDYKVYNQRNVIDQDYQIGEYFISDDKFEELKGFEVEANDFLVTSRGTIGKTYIVPEKAPKGVLHPCLIRVRLNEEKISNQYLDLLLSQTNILLEQLKVLSNATTIEVIYSNSLKEVLIPLPKKSEQENFLEKCLSIKKRFNTIIEQTSNQIEKLKEYRQSLISAAVTGKIDVRATEVHTKTKEPRKEISSWDKFVLAMEIIKRMQDNQHFGRIMLVKILFLVEYHLRVKGFNSNYKRWDHGPFDNQLINSVEYNLKKDGWINIESEESKNYDQKVYIPTKKAYEKSHYFKNSWGDLDDEIEQILSIFNDANSTQAEIIATVYAAYNDLLIEGKEPSEDEVLDEVLNNWHPNKNKISEERWRSAYRWIKEKEFVPTGFGKSTKEAA